MKLTNLFGLVFISLILAGCGSAAQTTVNKIDGSLNDVDAVQDYQGLKRTVAIARFSNETDSSKGFFYDKENDPVGRQAVDILSAKLAA